MKYGFEEIPRGCAKVPELEARARTFPPTLARSAAPWLQGRPRQGLRNGCRQVTEKLVPPERADVVAFVTPFATMSIRSGLNEPIAAPFTVVAE